MFRYKLRTLLILLAIGPPLMSIGYFARMPGQGQTVKGPIIYQAKFVGNCQISDKKLAKVIGVREGLRLNKNLAAHSRYKIKECYFLAGLQQPTVTLLEGDKAGDKNVVFQINEGSTAQP